MNNNDDEYFEASVEFDEKEKLFHLMEEAGLGKDVMSTVASELEETEDPVHNVLFVATTGRKTIKAIHVPTAAIDGREGPVLFAAANPTVVIAAFSREYISSNSDSVEIMPEGDREDAWAEFMGQLSDMVLSEMEVNPPAGYEEI